MVGVVVGVLVNVAVFVGGTVLVGIGVRVGVDVGVEVGSCDPSYIFVRNPIRVFGSGGVDWYGFARGKLVENVSPAT